LPECRIEGIAGLDCRIGQSIAAIIAGCRIAVLTPAAIASLKPDCRISQVTVVALRTQSGSPVNRRQSPQAAIRQFGNLQ
jgi:hypothetical protein